MEEGREERRTEERGRERKEGNIKRGKRGRKCIAIKEEERNKREETFRKINLKKR